MGSNELQHHGILGMRWGVRRRRGPEGRVKSKIESKSTERMTVETLRQKSIAAMTNQELKALNERLNLERQYKDLTSKDISFGKKIVNNVLKRVGNKILERVIDKSIEGAMDKVFKLVVKK